MNRPAPSTALLVVAGLAVFAFPLIAPAEEPPDRIEYAAERIDGPVDSWETLEYGNLSAESRTAFDAARSVSDGRHNVSIPTGGTLPPLADTDRPVVAYDLQYDGEWWLFQVKHFDPEVPFSAHLLRFGAFGVGALLLMGAGYRVVRA